ncbi:MAG: chaperonin GroEL [Candidatus Moranbacteria bacterium]|nr:chaperonin GroEL [Candidatus Moranbacteria bacterium]
MSKIIKFKSEAREKIKAGIDKVADAVKITLGPRGRNVVMGKSFGSPMITNDGVTIAKEIELEDKFESIGAELIKEVANKTNDVAGDGTTTAMVIAQALVQEGIKYVETGMNPVEIRHGMEAARDAVIKELKKNSKPVSGRNEIAQVATISAENKEMGELIAEVIEEVGKDGVITVEESQTFGFAKEIVKGLNFDKGYISPYMITNPESLKAELKDPYIIITDKKISTIAEILPIVEKIAATGKKDIVIIAEEVEGEALATLVVNKLRGSINVLAVKAPEFGDTKKEMLEDIAIVTGGKVISEETGMKMEKVEISDLGRAGKVIATKDATTIVGGKGKKDKLENRISQIKSQMEKSESKWDKEKLQKRMAKLTGGVAVIKVGAATETELTYIKHKMEDALSATKAAIEEGIVAGGGVALAKAANSLAENIKEERALSHEYRAGYQALIEALSDPLKQIVANTGKEKADVAINKVLENEGKNFGFNAATGKYVADMIKTGIIDPLKVTRTALENAVSVAAMLLTTEVAIADKPEEKSGSHNPGMSGMEGMM